jgi:hypothetical protein
MPYVGLNMSVWLAIGLWGAILEVLYLWSLLSEHFPIHSSWYPNICYQDIKCAYIFMRITKIITVVSDSLWMINAFRLSRIYTRIKNSGEVCICSSHAFWGYELHSLHVHITCPHTRSVLLHHICRLSFVSDSLCPFRLSSSFTLTCKCLIFSCNFFLTLSLAIRITQIL